MSDAALLVCKEKVSKKRRPEGYPETYPRINTMKSSFLQVPVAGIFCLVFTIFTSAASAACPPPFSKFIRNGGYGISDIQGKIIAS